MAKLAELTDPGVENHLRIQDREIANGGYDTGFRALSIHNFLWRHGWGEVEREIGSDVVTLNGVIVFRAGEFV